MKILILDPNYPGTGDIDVTFRERLTDELRAELGDLELRDVDAGPGAAEPGYLLEGWYFVASVVSTAAAVPVLKEHLPKWVAKFNQVVASLTARNLTFYVDVRSAQNLAAFYVLNKIGSGCRNLHIVCIHRHAWGPGMMCYEDIDVQTLSDTPPASTSIEDHLEAVKQNRSRYIIGVDVDGRAFTVVIEHNGRCGYIEPVT